MPAELRGDGLGEVCTPLTTARRSTQIQQLCYCRTGGNRLCHSKESRRPPATGIGTRVCINSGLCRLLSLSPCLFTITCFLGNLLLLGLERRKWMFPEVK